MYTYYGTQLKLSICSNWSYDSYPKSGGGSACVSSKPSMRSVGMAALRSSLAADSVPGLDRSWTAVSNGRSNGRRNQSNR